MPRMARVVVPDYPHHITQRGNRRQRTFFCTEDYRAYMRFVAKAKSRWGVDIWAYCLMPNHVHLVAVPRQRDSLARLFRDAHLKYTLRINKREHWRGHLWQERFHSFPMDEQHLLAAVRYVELNPVRAGLCESPCDWDWSSVHAHFRKKDDLLVDVAPMLQRVDDWPKFLAQPDSSERVESLRKHSRSGKPAGTDDFIGRLERLTGRTFCNTNAQRRGAEK